MRRRCISNVLVAHQYTLYAFLLSAGPKLPLLLNETELCTAVKLLCSRGLDVFGRGWDHIVRSRNDCTWSFKLLEAYVYLCLCLVEWTAAGRYVRPHETAVHRCWARRAPCMSLWKTTCQWIYSRVASLKSCLTYGTTYLIKNDSVSETLQRHEQCDPGLTCTGICYSMHTSTGRMTCAYTNISALNLQG